MRNFKDIEYIRRRQRLKDQYTYFQKMVESLNNDRWFRLAKLQFSDYSNNGHFLERFDDRELDMIEILPKFYRFILKHRCEFVYFARLESKPDRLELELDNIRMGLTMYDNRFTFRTIFTQHRNRFQGSASHMLISDTTKYYEQ